MSSCTVHIQRDRLTEREGEGGDIEGDKERRPDGGNGWQKAEEQTTVAERNPYPLVSIRPIKCTDRSLSPTCNKLPANHNLIQEQTANHNWFTEENWKDNYTVGRGGGRRWGERRSRRSWREAKDGRERVRALKEWEDETRRVMKRGSEDSSQMWLGY